MELGAIFLNVLLPVLLMVGLGALLRWRFELDLSTLSKVNLYLMTPAFIFDRVTHASLGWQEMAGTILATIILLTVLGTTVGMAGKALGASRATTAAIATAVMFYNSGNVGLPLAELAYPPDSPHGSGGVAQAFVVLTQNVMTFTVGLVIASSAAAHSFKQIAVRLLSLPVLYTLTAALATRWWLGLSSDNHIPKAIDATCKYLAGGLIPVALVLLGAQLMHKPRWPRWKPVSAVLVIRLFAAPAVMAGLLYAFHRLLPHTMLDLWPWPAEQIIFTAAVPTAVNTLILTMELDGDTDLAADCVFWTTLLSALTLGPWLLASRWIMATFP
ncbi:MAG: AEC family transporter [Tepidisphaeraceae bacterium]